MTTRKRTTSTPARSHTFSPPIEAFSPEPVSEPTFEREERPPLARRAARRMKRYALLAIIALVILLAVARIFHWFDWGRSPEEIQAREVAALVQKVDALMILPGNETPVVAVVNDAQALKAQQSFYKDAEDGDMLLVYTVNQKAVLYRERTNKIVNVGPALFE